MMRLFGYLFLFVMLLPIRATAKDHVEQWMDKLDVSLSHKQQYEQLKEDHINKLQRTLSETTDMNTRYALECQLFDEYKSYRFDSSAVCAGRALEIALHLDNPVYIVESKCNLAFSLISAGIMLEAQKILSSIDASKLTVDCKKRYYGLWVKFWREEADLNHDLPYYNEYIEKSNSMVDSLLALITPKSAEWYNVVGSKYMRDHQYKKAIESFNKYLSDKHITAHDRAMCHAELAWAYIYLKDEDKAIENFVQSAIYDNETATREITALYHVARLINDRGDFDRAIEYVHLALNDVGFYNTRQRLIELGEILPQIEQERYNAVKAQRNLYLIVTCLSVILFVVSLLSVLFIRKRNRQLEIARQKEHQHAAEIESVNSQLLEANRIKTEYIGLSFYANAEAIAKMEKLYKSIERQVTTKQYDKIKETVNPQHLDKERENMYASFDNSFLGLYPTFVEEYNKLFEGKDRRQPAEGRLTSEMRIFALIRIGITDSERIGKFLDYSVHTVNTYKTRIKNRSIVDNEQFESRIRNIQ